jgi:TolB-like protein
MTFRFHCYTIDPARRELRRSGELVHVEPQVFDVIVYLVENRYRVVSKDELFANVWHGRIVSETTLSSRVNAARRAIGDTGSRRALIQTVARRGFRFIGEATKQETAASERLALNAERAHAPEPSIGQAVEKPSIAVLPFASTSRDPAQNYFAVGMAEGLINSLSHIRWLTVIARNSSFLYKEAGIDSRKVARELNVRYLLEGSVYKGGRLVRITAQLSDAETGAHLWSDKFDGELKNVFVLQDQIAAKVSGAIEPPLRGAEIERARRKGPNNLNAYDLYLRALPHAYAYTREGRTLALELLSQALANDPKFVEAHGLAAWCYIQRIWAESAQSKTDLASAHKHAEAVMSLTTDDASTLAFAANAYARATQDYQTAIQMIEHALANNPSSAHAHAVGAVVNAWAERYDIAVEFAERALRLSPFDPARHLAFAALARSRLFQGNPSLALAAARRAVQASPGHLPSHGYMIISLVRLGLTGELSTTVERLLANVPRASLSQFAAHVVFRPFMKELSAAGLPR